MTRQQSRTLDRFEQMGYSPSIKVVGRDGTIRVVMWGKTEKWVVIDVFPNGVWSDYHLRAELEEAA